MSPETPLPKAIADLQKLGNQPYLLTGYNGRFAVMDDQNNASDQYYSSTQEGQQVLCKHLGAQSIDELVGPTFLFKEFSRRVGVVCERIKAIQELSDSQISSHIEDIDMAISVCLGKWLKSVPFSVLQLQHSGQIRKDRSDAWVDTLRFLYHDSAYLKFLLSPKASAADHEHYLSAWQYMIDAFRIFLESHHNAPASEQQTEHPNVPSMQMDKVFPWMASAMEASRHYFDPQLQKAGYRITCTPLERANTTIPASLSGPLFVAVFNAIKNSGRAAMAYFAKQGIHSKDIPTAAQGQGIHIAYGVEDIHGIPHARVKITDSFGGLDATAVMQQMKVFIASEEHFLWLMNLPDDVLSLHAKRAVLAWRGFKDQPGNPYAYKAVLANVDELINMQHISGKGIAESGGVGLAACMQILRSHMGAIFTGSSASTNGGFCTEFLLPLDTPLLSAAIYGSPHSLVA